ncbi:carbohydrate ABC transporter permease [Cohnella cholangitidis]|uniref:Carbohydrate ABC transporter permease n=1 Tax=Cohnella cholangitidis TaxID=2598458 RepID=A0A7G5C7A8_9BACL|nr:carbohydrate ABC transporter permease [Cohnella cholangitidis]QMV45092.1 carbohydrate ABC transporter permease [Cohnella cholangitidis]
MLMLLLFIVVTVLMLTPFYAIIVASLKPAKLAISSGLSYKIDWELFTFENYRSLFTESADTYFTWFKNSIVITILATILSLFLSAFVGYGLAMYDFKLKNVIFVAILLVMMVPMEIIMLPLYKLMISFKMINTLWGVIIPFAVAPLPTFFFRQYASGLPKDFMDAGRIDGCTEYGMFFRIFIPLMVPAFGAMVILIALSNWNNFLWPLLILRTNDMLTIPIGLSTLLTPYGNNYQMLIAGSVMAILPILLLFVFFQRYFISGLTVGGVKG